jgi:hypothetical protein
MMHQDISILTTLFLALAQCRAMLCNVVQLWQVNKLQTEPAMLRFRQVAASNTADRGGYNMHTYVLAGRRPMLRTAETSPQF